MVTIKIEIFLTVDEPTAIPERVLQGTIGQTLINNAPSVLNDTILQLRNKGFSIKHRATVITAE